MAAPTTSGQEPGWLAYYARKVRRHIHWARTEGVARLVEEDRLDPRERLQTAWRKARWRRRHGLPPGSAVPVYVVGLQRSGTNMLMRGVDLAPEVEVRNENDRTVFRRFTLRSDAVLVQTVRDSRHALVLVKPLCESHRVDELLDLAVSRRDARCGSSANLSRAPAPRCPSSGRPTCGRCGPSPPERARPSGRVSACRPSRSSSCGPSTLPQ